MPKKLGLIGQRFGRIVVKGGAGISKHKQSLWFCKCDCGNKTVVIGINLKAGRTRSCGCYNREINSERMSNRIVSEETRQKMSESKKGVYVGKNNPNYGNGSKISGKKNPNYGRMGEKAFGYKHGLSRTNAYKNQMSAKRREDIRNQTSPDADLRKIQSIYLFCETLNRQGGEYEVDHIKPISRGGQHHQDNLQILSKSLNRKKRNKITDEYVGITLADIERGGRVDVIENDFGRS